MTMENMGYKKMKKIKEIKINRGNDKKFNFKFNFQLIFTLLSLLFSLILFSFSINALTIQDFNPDPISIVYGATSFSFTLVEDSGVNLTDINASCLLPFSGTCQVTCPSELQQSQTADCFGILNVPQYTPAGSYIGTINVTANTSFGLITNKTTFGINVLEEHSLSIIYSIDNIMPNETKLISVEFKNTGNIDLLVSASTKVEDETGTLVGEIVSNLNESTFLLSPGESKHVSLTLTTQYAYPGTYYLYIIADAQNSQYNVNFNVTEKKSFFVLYDYCGSDTSPQYLNIDIRNLGDFEGKNFEPFENFDVKIRVRNNDNNDHDVSLYTVLVDNGNVISESEISKDLTVNSNSQETITLSMELPLLDEKRYDLYIKAEDNDDESVCVQKRSYININRPIRKVAPKKVITDKDKYACGESLLVSGSVVNIGSRDEDLVKLQYSDDLNNLIETTFSLDVDDEKNFLFQPKVPLNASEGQHRFNLKIYYNYDDNTNSFNDVDNYVYYFSVEGNCIVPSKDAELNITLPSNMFLNNTYEGVIVVKNTGTVATTYQIEVPIDWAQVNLDTTLFTLSPQEEKTINIVMTPTTVGSKLLSVTVKFDNEEKTITKIISVSSRESVEGAKYKKATWWDEVRFEFERNPILLSIVIASIIIALVCIIALLIVLSKRK